MANPFGMTPWQPCQVCGMPVAVGRGGIHEECREQRQHEQWLTFAIHRPDQPDIPCCICHQPATWLQVWWGGDAYQLAGRAYCDLHAKVYSDERRKTGE